MHLIMFDIDGTLVDSSPLHGRLLKDAIEAELGCGIDNNWAGYRHMTDSGIVAEILERHDLHDSTVVIAERIRSRFVEAFHAHLHSAAGSVLEVPGARDLVQALLGRPDVRVAVATGGWSGAAMLKLRAIGLDPAGFAFASGCDAPARTQIMSIAECRAMKANTARRRTYFGDGPWDQRASAELGYQFICIGSRVECELAFPDFRDHDAVLQALSLTA